MNDTRKILSVLCALALLAIGQSVYAAPKVEPKVISGASDKLGLAYSELDPDTTYTVKRSVVRGGTPSGDWEIIGRVGKSNPPITEDTGLEEDKQYAYALFDETGEKKVQSSWYSQIPNNQIATLGSEEKGALGSGNPGTEQPLATPPLGRTPPPPPATTDFTLGGLLTRAEGILNLIVPFIIGLAVFVIIWGIFLYVTKAAEEEKRSEARLYIVWGIVAVFCMLSLWGFVNILVNSLNLQTTLAPSSIPTVPELQ